MVVALMGPGGYWRRAGRLLAVLAFLASLAAAGYLVTAQSWGLSSGETATVVPAGAGPAGTTVVSSWTNRPERNPGNEGIMKFWAGVLVALALASLLAALRGLTAIVWVAGGLLTILAILGMMTLGILIAPVALLLLLAALCLSIGKVPSRPS
jgi:hypothetical protein